jgi:DNA-binding CsgD family transcriptional regulator
MPFDGYLSERELAVLDLVADGRTNGEIAETLVLSEGTVRTHVAHIFDKLDIHNRHHLGRVYRRLQALPLDVRAVLDSRQPVPNELEGGLNAFVADLELPSIDHARYIYRLAIIRSG